MNIELKSIVDYLNKKHVPFLIKYDYNNKTSSIEGITITKKDKFFRANNIIISGNIAMYFIKRGEL